MSTRTVKINVGGGYDVKIGSGILSKCGEYISAVTGVCRAAIITDSNVERLYLKTAVKSLEDAGFSVDCFVFPAGEESKNISTLSNILEFLAERSFTRSDIVIALGGGVTGDITGFAAAVYLRGINYIQIPTTLLASVDSSVGGKTAIDLTAGKNLAGAFKQPKLVICDVDTLSTLPSEEFANGMAESIKYGVLFSDLLFSQLSKDLSSDSLIETVARCVEFKGIVVERDEFDNGERKLLNLGHTIGHAIEKCSNFKIAHGHAVAIGMAMIARAGEALGITKIGTAALIEKALVKYNLPINTDFDTDALVRASLSDKKREGAKITLILPLEIGKCTLKNEPVTELEKYIKFGKAQ